MVTLLLLPPCQPGTYPGSRGILVDGVFGLRVRECVRCSMCSKETHVVAAHYEHMLVVNSMALSLSASLADTSGDMGRLLRDMFDQEQKACDRDEGGCGHWNVSRTGGRGTVDGDTGCSSKKLVWCDSRQAVWPGAGVRWRSRCHSRGSMPSA
jgi:hypothetical protein